MRTLVCLTISVDIKQSRQNPHRDLFRVLRANISDHFLRHCHQKQERRPVRRPYVAFHNPRNHGRARDLFNSLYEYVQDFVMTESKIKNQHLDVTWEESLPIEIDEFLR